MNETAPKVEEAPNAQVAPPPVAAPEDPSPLPLSQRFPSNFLILLHVLSFFLATAAFCSAVFSVYFPLVIVINTIAFALTVPFHVYLYFIARKHRQSPIDADASSIFITPNCLTYSFLLVAFWLVVFLCNILGCVHTYGEAPVIVATIWSGFEWIVLFIIALKCAREVWRIEKATASSAERQLGTSTVDESDPNAYVSPRVRRPCYPTDAILRPRVPTPKPRHAFLMSFIFSTLALIFSLSASPIIAANIIAFLMTAPHHISIYVASLRPGAHLPFLARLRPGVAWSFTLAMIWCLVFMLDILFASGLWRKILTGIFGGLEVLIVIGLAGRSVVESLAEGQIRI